MANKREEIAKSIYAAFNRGDTKFVLDRMTDDVELSYAIIGDSPVPWHKPVRGKQNVPAWFKLVTDDVAMHKFEILEYVSNGDKVVAKLRLTITMKRTNTKLVEDQLQWFEFDDNDKIKLYRTYSDTAAIIAAWTGKK